MNKNPLFAVLSCCLILTPGLSAASDWVTLSGLSYHFQQDREDWRQFNPGLGWERDAGHHDLVWSAGYYQNSYDKPTVYGGARWMPLETGPIKWGLYGLLATGYPSPVLVSPVISTEWGPVGLNVVLVPNLPGYSGFIGGQLRFKLN